MTEQPFIWCVVANVTREPHPEGPGGEMRLGTKRFAPGAELYCCKTEWADGCERLRDSGRHRGGGPKLIEIVVSTKWLTNWHVQKVYQPQVVQFMKSRWMWNDSDESLRIATKLAEWLRTCLLDHAG